VVTANPGCLLQLQAGAARRGQRVQVRHIADVLDEAYRAAPEQAARDDGAGAAVPAEETAHAR